ncbi:sodium/solute symporter [uncultured Salegentibacter sp.]|uniref:sodium:solute symporter family transporter n=1 Tax=uncultured Salegentibacter sp. TaxID=259320 RepID=UPI0025933855|nr:sodium/solute symporter [uncultured Salegentibacter sp.]
MNITIKEQIDSFFTCQKKPVTRLIIILMFFLGFSGISQEEPSKGAYFSWNEIELPAPQGERSQAGLAGAFSGVSNGALIIAGGANFPETAPWEGGNKVWWDQIYVLLKEEGSYKWATNVTQKLATPAAYGVSISTPEGLLCIGGNNEKGVLNDIFLLQWDPIKKELGQKKLGNLPEGFEATAGVSINSVIYVSGIHNGANALIKIPVTGLLNGNEGHKWTRLEGCPGPPRKLMAYAAQTNGEDMCFFQFSGRSEVDGEFELLKTAYAFNVDTEEWSALGDITHSENPEVVLMGAPAVAYGSNGILLFGGDDGELFLERAELERKLTSGSAISKDSIQMTLTESFLDHPGFGSEILMYNTITNRFNIIDSLPQQAPVVTNALMWDDQVILPSGEIKPGVRSPKVLTAKILNATEPFGFLNYSMLGIYFLVLLGMGIYFSARQKTTEDYFKGGGRIPWWAAGISIFGTALSAITFMAIPAKTFATDWSYFLNNMSVLLVTPVLVFWFIPFFRRLNVTTAYEYLEKRFNLLVRLFGSASFILFQIGRIAIVLYLPAIALSLVTGIDIYFCILTMGILSTIYTLVGGIEAVIWTDVLQVIILMGGALAALVLISFSLEGNVFTAIQTASAQEKFNIIDLNFSLSEPTIWVVIIGGFFANLVTYSSDQTLVQRYLTTSDEKGAKRTAWTNAVLIIPSTLLFFSIGTALFLFYQELPDKADPLAQDIDAVFPWYIVKEMPNGVSGLLIAGLFSAAMSSLSSSLNSVATSFTTDFYGRFRNNSHTTAMMNVAKISTLVAGILGTLFALWMSSAGIVSLWDQFFTVLGLFTGGLGGLFFLGIISKQANGTGAMVGLVVSSLVQYYVAYYTDLHIFLYAATGFLACVIVGHLASLIIPDHRNEEGKQLTIYNKLFSNKGQANF